MDWIYRIDYIEFFVSDWTWNCPSVETASPHEGRLESLISEMLRQFQAKMDATIKTGQEQMRAEIKVGKLEIKSDQEEVKSKMDTCH
jgi:hypothetical protein